MLRVLSFLGFSALAAVALAGCSTGRPAGVSVVSFDAERYLGQWHEIARLDHSFERGLTHVTARYAALPDGRIEVINRGFSPAKCKWDEQVGSAKFQGPRDQASLSVSFFWPISGGYHVFALDPDYRWALVSGPSRDYLWILARDPVLAPDVKERLIATAREKGFDVDKLIWVDQSQPARCADGSVAPN